MSTANETSSTDDGDAGDAIRESSAAEAVALLPTAEQLEIAESILDRLKPSDRQDIGAMIHRRGQVAGGLLAAVGIFWWLAVLRSDGDGGHTSLINDLTFLTVSWVLPLLVFVGSLLNAAGRHRGQPAPSLLAGILFLVGAFFVAEPLVLAIATNMSMADGGWMTLRLAAIAVGTWFSAKLFIEAFLLDWVKKLEEAFQGIELSALSTERPDAAEPEIEPEFEPAV